MSHMNFVFGWSFQTVAVSFSRKSISDWPNCLEPSLSSGF